MSTPVHKVGEEGKVIDLDCGTDISASTSRTMRVTKPDGSQVNWTAVVHPSDNNKIRYTVQSGDWDLPGDWYVFAQVVLPGYPVLKGTTYKFRLLSEFEES